MKKIVSILIVMIISLALAQDASARGWGRWYHPRPYFAPVPYVRPYYAPPPPVYRERWIQPHYRRTPYGDQWVPGHWARPRPY
jgi:hypothetical protein